jgi:hypothetical protein
MLFYSTITNYTLSSLFSCSFCKSCSSPAFVSVFFYLSHSFYNSLTLFLFIYFNSVYGCLQLWCPLSLFYGIFILLLTMKLIIAFSISGFEFSCFISSSFSYLGIFCIFAYIKAIHPPFFIEYYISTYSTVEHHIPKEIGVLKMTDWNQYTTL